MPQGLIVTAVVVDVDAAIDAAVVEDVSAVIEVAVAVVVAASAADVQTIVSQYCYCTANQTGRRDIVHFVKCSRLFPMPRRDW